MFARHTFSFEAAGPGATRIISSEPWTGLVTNVKPVADKIQRAAAAGGEAMLVGFDRWYTRNGARAA